MTGPAQRRSEPDGLEHSWIGVLSPAAFLAFGVYMVVSGLGGLTFWAASGPGSGFFPVLVGALLCCVSAAVAVKELTGRTSGRTAASADEEPDPPQRGGGRLVLGAMVCIAVAVALVPWAGLIGAIFLAQVAVLKWGDRHGWLASIVFALVSSTAVYFMFEMAFEVRLPGGLLFG